MQERQFRQGPIEAPYVTVVKDIVARKIPEHQESFDILLEEINRQITGEGLSLWESTDQPGVSFLAGRLEITPEIIRGISRNGSFPDVDPESDLQRLSKHVYFLQPSFGFGNEGNAFSILGYGIDRFIREMPKVARAMKNGEKSPEVEIYLLGNPKAFGGTVSEDYVDSVRENGFSQQGRLYAEFMEDQLDCVHLDRSRIVIQATSKGTITADKTFDYLPDEIKSRTQLLFDNPAATHESGILERALRAYNLGLGSLVEASARRRYGLVRRDALAGRVNFYESIAKLKNIPEDSSEQRRLKRRLLMTGELWNIAKGTPLDSSHRSYTRVPAVDSLYIGLPNLIRLKTSAEDEEIEIFETEESEGEVEIKGRKGLVAEQDGKD